MGKKSKGEGGQAGSRLVCGACTNYRASGKKKGRCARKDKKRAASEKACGHFEKA